MKQFKAGDEVMYRGQKVKLTRLINPGSASHMQFEIDPKLNDPLLCWIDREYAMDSECSELPVEPVKPEQKLNVCQEADQIAGQGKTVEPVKPDGYVTKDSGQREQFESGMVRDTAANKTDYTLVLDGPMFERWAQLLARGAVKYKKRNWMQANGQAEYERFRESALRHFIQWFRGDEDEDHAAAVMFNLNGAEYVKEKL